MCPAEVTRELAPSLLGFRCETSFNRPVRLLMHRILGRLTSVAAFFFLATTVCAQGILVPRGSVWKYLDNGSDQGAAWQGTNFNDSAWASGPARLGYGGDGEVTAVNYGPD